MELSTQPGIMEIYETVMNIDYLGFMMVLYAFIWFYDGFMMVYDGFLD